MKKLAAFILLLCHMNNSMFLPQGAEDDQFDKNGNQVDDINSVCEYIDQVILGNIDKTPEDEDTDDGQNFHVVKTMEYSFERQSILVRPLSFIEIKQTEFADYKIYFLTSPSMDITTPPPDKYTS